MPNDELSLEEMLESAKAALALVELLPKPFHSTEPPTAESLLLGSLVVRLYPNDPAQGTRAMASLLRFSLEQGVVHFESLLRKRGALE